MVRDPEVVHVCVICGEVDNEDSPDFDMQHCDYAVGWLHRDCHTDIGCRQPLCDPNHI